MSGDDTETKDEIKAALEGAVEVLPRMADDEGLPEERDGGGGYDPAREDEFDPKDLPTVHHLPKNFPVTPLGVLVESAYFLDGMSQLREIKFKDFGKMRLQSLFIPQPGVVVRYWPRVDAKGEATGGWRNEDCSTVLMHHAAERGIFNPVERLRGRGCHRGIDGGLIWHLGNVVLVDGVPVPPGLIEDHVYPGAERCLKPKPHEDIPTPGQELKDLFSSWNFTRMNVDPLLLFGWVMAAKIGGALDWRPLVWITGDAATGKSTLHKVIEKVLCDVIAVTDTTGAGVWQKLGYDTLPVIIDELEADADNRQSQKVIKLAREAASGGKILRGGSEHNGQEFQAMSSFMFSSILHPPLPPQDKSRLAILDLKPIPAGKMAPVLDYKHLRRVGQALMERISRHFNQLDQVMDIYVRALAAVGHTGRSADVFGTLLACAHIGLWDDLPTDEEAGKWAELLSPDILSENDDRMSDAEACIRHLLSTEIDPYHGGRRSLISEIIIKACGFDQENGVPDKSSQKDLERFGMKIILPDLVDGAGEPVKEPLLLVANQHRTLGELFKGTHWQGRADGPGVWKQALRRVEGSMGWEPTKFAGFNSRSTALSVRAMLDIED